MLGSVLFNSRGGLSVVLVLACYFTFKAVPSAQTGISAAAPAARGGLSVTEDSGRILLRWAGQVDGPMVKTLESALAKYRYDERPLRLALNSAGGQVSAGRDLLDLIDWMKRQRRLETHVDKGAMCASMCVPIYLSGSRRTADPKARFMFHEARIARNTTEYTDLRKRMEGVMSRAQADAVEQRALGQTTDTLFGSDMNYWDVNETWLRRMRQAVRGGKDVWLTAEQLVDQGSGIVHALE